MTDLEKALTAYGGIQYALKQPISDKSLKVLLRQESQMLEVINRLSQEDCQSVLCESQKYIYDLL